MANILTNLAAERRRISPDKTAYRFRTAPGQWSERRWADFSADIDHAAYALETLGLKPSEMIAVFSANCPQMLITDFATYRNRAVPVALYATSSPEQVEYIINDSGARIAFAGDRKQYDTLHSLSLIHI